MDQRTYQRIWARNKRKKAPTQATVIFRAKDAERQRKRRESIDPNYAREYARERRFRFAKETALGRYLKECGLSIVTDLQIRAGLFIFEYKGIRTRERLIELK